MAEDSSNGESTFEFVDPKNEPKAQTPKAQNKIHSGILDVCVILTNFNYN